MDDIELEIAGKKVGINHPPFIIAEVAQAHDGSLGIAHSFIDAVAETGVDAIKFQTHITDAETTPNEPWRVKFSYEDATRWDYWKRMEFSAQQWKELADHAKEKGLVFLSSPFSIEAVEMLNEIGMDAWKIASGEVTNQPMLNAITKCGQPVLFSTGLASDEEIQEAVQYCRNQDTSVGIFDCTTRYPTRAEDLDLNRITKLRDAYEVPVGLSDHSGKIYAPIAAVDKGASLIEFHVAFSRKMFGPDAPASLVVDELPMVVEGCRYVWEANRPRQDEANYLEERERLRKTFLKSIYVKENLPRDSVLRREDLCVKKPGTGIPANKFDEIVGRKLKKIVDKDHPLSWEDLT